MEYKNIYEQLCEVFNFNKGTKEISYEIGFDNYNIYKSLLFQFCFLINKGSIKFERLQDLWFFKNLNNFEEIKIIFGIIEALLEKIKDKNVNIQQKNISLVKDFLNLKNQDKFEIFKYLQSIYAFYKDDPEMVFFPLIYSISFDNSFMKKNMKQDFKSIIEEKLKIENSIQYDNINKEFLKKFNRVLNEENTKSMEIFRYFSVLKTLLKNMKKD